MLSIYPSIPCPSFSVLAPFLIVHSQDLFFLLLPLILHSPPRIGRASYDRCPYPSIVMFVERKWPGKVVLMPEISRICPNRIPPSAFRSDMLCTLSVSVPLFFCQFGHGEAMSIDRQMKDMLYAAASADGGPSKTSPDGKREKFLVQGKQ